MPFCHKIAIKLVQKLTTFAFPIKAIFVCIILYLVFKKIIIIMTHPSKHPPTWTQSRLLLFCILPLNKWPLVNLDVVFHDPVYAPLDWDSFMEIWLYPPLVLCGLNWLDSNYVCSNTSSNYKQQIGMNIFHYIHIECKINYPYILVSFPENVSQIGLCTYMQWLFLMMHMDFVLCFCH